ncbi:MAG: DNA-deoxyinosine glycosylase [Acidiferrobacterales bacterium]|nr:DNA-deoxyinosine glycosylase [Acidiferrobacterales bacterium]
MPSFLPIVGSDTEILILGTMPSQLSLSQAKYYAHPRNAFWWIMSRLLGFPDQLSYAERCRYIKQSKFGLWDVLYSCNRKGSMDKNIEKDSEQANDFGGLFNDHKNIKRIAFNGLAARTIFVRHCNDLIASRDYIQFIQLPSTSPAHAKLSRQEKLIQWRDRLL